MWRDVVIFSLINTKWSIFNSSKGRARVCNLLQRNNEKKKNKVFLHYAFAPRFLISMFESPEFFSYKTDMRISIFFRDRIYLIIPMIFRVSLYKFYIPIFCATSLVIIYNFLFISLYMRAVLQELIVGRTMCMLIKVRTFAYLRCQSNEKLFLV